MSCIRWAASISAFSLFACTSVDTGGTAGYRGPVNGCESDSDCPAGSTCDKSLWICATGGPTEVRKYFVKVIPRAETNVPEQVFEVILGPDSQSPLKLKAYALTPEFKLKVDARDRNNQKTSLDLQAVITDVGLRLPDDPETITLAAVSIPADTIGKSPWIRLLPGENHVYQLKIIPTGEKADSFPVHYFDDISITETGGLYDSEGNKNPIFMISEAVTEVAGTIVRGEQNVDGLSVEAVDPLTGRAVSTRALTGCQEGLYGGKICGDFEFGLSRDVTHFSLRIWRANEPWYPEIIVPGFAIEEDYSGSMPIGREPRTELGQIELEALGIPVNYRAFVRKPVLLPNGETEYDGLGNSLVVFASDDVAGGRAGRTVFTNEAGALEDENGNLGADLFPGPYRITVIPPDQFGEADLEYSLLNWEMEQISGTSEIEGQIFPLEERPLFTGSVVAGGELVFGAVLRAEPHSSAPAFSRTSVASVDSNGFFSIRIDKGQYRLAAEVPDKSGYAWAAKTIEVAGGADFDIELPIPFVARLELVLGSGETTADVAGASVEWYEEIDGRAFPAGRTSSDAFGQVTALLRP